MGGGYRNGAREQARGKSLKQRLTDWSSTLRSPHQRDRQRHHQPHCRGLWTALISALLFRDHKIVASAGIAIAAGVAVGLLEPFGVGIAGAVVATAFSLWAVWALIVGVVILRGKTESVVGLPQAA
jgi:hypothetical protein